MLSYANSVQYMDFDNVQSISSDIGNIYKNTHTQTFLFGTTHNKGKMPPYWLFMPWKLHI